MHTCIYIHISCPHTYTHTHIYTHAYKMYTWTHAKHVWNDGAAATAREAQLDTKKLCPSPCPLQSGGGYHSWPAPQSPVHEKWRISAEQPQPTVAHSTITIAHRPDHIRLSALVRSQSTQFIVHASSQLGRGPPKRGHFFAILAGFFPRIKPFIHTNHSEAYFMWKSKQFVHTLRLPWRQLVIHQGEQTNKQTRWCVTDLKSGLRIFETNVRIQWNPVYRVFHPIRCCGNKINC